MPLATLFPKLGLFMDQGRLTTFGFMADASTHAASSPSFRSLSTTCVGIWRGYGAFVSCISSNRRLFRITGLGKRFFVPWPNHDLESPVETAHL